MPGLRLPLIAARHVGLRLASRLGVARRPVPFFVMKVTGACNARCITTCNVSLASTPARGGDGRRAVRFAIVDDMAK